MRSRFQDGFRRELLSLFYLALEMTGLIIMINRRNAFIILPVLLLGVTGISRADSVLGVASAYNLLALGYGTTPGTISVSSDVGGRIAASGRVLNAPVVGQSLINDPYAALADGYLMVAGSGVSSGEHTNVQASGSIYALGADSSQFNFNDGGSLVSSGASPIDFSSLSTSLDAESLYLGSLLTTGQVLTAGQSGFPSGANPSWLVLDGTSAAVDIFDITAAQLANVNDPLDIVVPNGATVIINVSGTADSLGGGIYINGIQPSQTGDAGANVLFNFDDATSVSLGGQFTASMLAPFAVVVGNSSIDGTIIAAQIADSGEVHNAEFTGSLPSPPTAATPEPGSLVLLGTGMMGIAGLKLCKRTMDRGSPRPV
jgi:choice-of-anchor A domain-containing protein